MKARLVFWLGMLGMALHSAAVLSQDFPTRPIRIVVAVGAGVAADTIARLIGPEMSNALGQSVVVENKPGANYLLAYDYVAKQVPADGYTTAVASLPDLAILPLTVKDIRFDPVKDLPAVVGLVEARVVMGSTSKAPWKTFDEMIAYAKANPGKLNFGSGSSFGQLVPAAILQLKGAQMVHIPYQGGPQYSQALTSGEIQMGILSEGLANSFGDRFRVLAVTGSQRSSTFRDAPTFTELGMPQVPGTSFSLNTPAGVPRATRDKLSAAASRAIQRPEIRAQLLKVGFDVIDQPGEVTQEKLAGEMKFFADIAKQVGISPQ